MVFKNIPYPATPLYMYVYEYLGFALIQLPEAFLSMYMHMKTYHDKHVTKEKPVDTEELSMENQKSIATTQLEKFSYTRTYSRRILSLKKNDGNFKRMFPIADVVCKMKNDLEFMAIRMDEMESEISRFSHNNDE